MHVLEIYNSVLIKILQCVFLRRFVKGMFLSVLRRLSKWQLPVQSVTKMSSKWRRLRFSECIVGSGTELATNDLGYLNIKTSPYQYRDPNVKDKTVSWPSYLKHGNPHTRKRRSLYWDGNQILLWPRHQTSLIVSMLIFQVCPSPAELPWRNSLSVTLFLRW